MSFGAILGGFGSIVGGIGSFIAGQDTAQADQDEANAFNTAAEYAQQNEFFAGEAGGLQNLATARKIQQTQGQQAATAAANGLEGAGSALSLMRDTISQGALAEGQIGLQTAINVTGYAGQAAADEGMAAAAKAQAQAASDSGTFGLLGGILGGAAKLFGLF